MADLNEAMKHLEKSIKVLEQQIYNFETVSQPRYEADKKILAKLRSDYIKMDAMKQKRERGEEIMPEEWNDAIPEAFR